MATGNVPVQAVREAATRSVTQSLAGVAPPEVNEEAQEVAIAEASQALQVEEFSADQIREIAGAFGEAVGIINRGLRFEIDQESNEVITQVIDRETDEVVRQIPPQELLDISSRLRSFVGTLLDQQG